MRIGILTSGGDAPGMNAAIRALAVVGRARGHQIVGIRHGYHGLLTGEWSDLEADVIEGITRQGGTVLGSSRCLEMMEVAGQRAALDRLTTAKIEGLIVIGGNGSLTGAHALAGLARESSLPLRVVGLPASIDNDIGHAGLAIGVDTAVNTIVDACDRISDTARAHKRCFIVEVMGRNCGFLAMRAGIAAEADAILYGEAHLDEDQVVERMRKMLARCFAPGREKKRVLIVKSEGLAFPVARLRQRVQEALSTIVKGIDVRETVLGHVVRGGDPSALDRTIAQRLSFGAMLALEGGLTDVMLGWEPPFGVGRETLDPSVRVLPLDEVLAETARLLDGTSPVIQRRVAMLSQVEEILPG
ncbi:MAG: 6-phosphofructokinase [Polyangiaceae bacterium]|nr:6-phosphofructokinase [Polyangiaceae bacterium]